MATGPSFPGCRACTADLLVAIEVRDVMDNLRDAWRQLRQAPFVAVVVTVSLAIGIGVNTSVFSWVQARLFHPLPGVDASASLRLIEPQNDAGLFVGTSWPDYLDLRRRMRTMPDLIASRMMPAYIGEPGSVERVYGALVSDNYFSALGVLPVAGRGFEIDDVLEGDKPIVVISHGLWQSRYGGEPGVVGQVLRVNGQPLTIVGVVPAEFQGTHFGLNFDLWVPATSAPLVANGSTEIRTRDSRGYSVIGRLAHGASQDDAQHEVTAAMRELARAHPDSNANISARVLAFWESPRGPQRLMATALVVLQGLMLLLWLAVCGNTANLILARTSGRYRDISVRLALGATPARIRAMLMTETMVQGGVGAIAGALIAVWGTQALMLVPTTSLPVRFQTEMDGGGLLFALALGVLSGVLVGIGPAWQLSRLEPQSVFRTAVRTAGRSGLRNTLMALQVGLAVIVLVVAGLFLRSFQETRTTDPGFRQEGVLLAAFDFSGRPSAQASAKTMAGRLLDELAAMPGVDAAAIASSVPLDLHGLPSRTFTVDGRRRADGDMDTALANTVTPGYFATLDIALLAGRDFTALTSQAESFELVVNEAFVRRYVDSVAPLETAVGRTVQSRGRDQVVVGVVETTLSDAFGEPPTPAMYFSYRDFASAMGEMHVRTRPGAELALVPGVRRAVRAIDPELPVFNVRTLTEHVETNLVFRRVPARIFLLLGPLLLALAAAGIYAVVSYATALRTTEIGIRLALGATPRRLVTESVVDSLRVVIAGAVVGWVVIFVGVLLLMPSQASEVSAFVGVPAVMLAVAAAACWIPSRRCATVDPVVSLRSE
jgi:predicted permease